MNKYKLMHVVYKCLKRDDEGDVKDEYIRN